jgi:hypothetical protein
MTLKSDSKNLSRILDLIDESSYQNGLTTINKKLEEETGIVNFFHSFKDVQKFKSLNPEINNNIVKDLGDFQTPIKLTDTICDLVNSTGFYPDIVIEPNSGEGRFVISAINNFASLKFVYCIDIQPDYEWKLKQNIAAHFMKNHVPIEFHLDNIFTHKFSDGLLNLLKDESLNVLILGNPPWVTSSELSTLNSTNLPKKSNFKGLKGIEAITGKSNFDIAEYIILQLIQRFSNRKSKLAMLCKRIVARNIVRDMNKLELPLSNIKEYVIDSKKEFGISVESGLLMADIGLKNEHFSDVYSIYDKSLLVKKRYGWVGNKFVSNVEFYTRYSLLDGKSPFEWRTGVKHDATNVLVLKERTDKQLENGLNEVVTLEEDLMYPHLKGSQLRQKFVQNTKNRIIITQKRPLQDTTYLKSAYPELWRYLTNHLKDFDQRKSIIYKKGPLFSIFGIGDYSFKPYKVAISGFYKSPIFCLVPPINNKPVMVDDTSYFLSFEDKQMATITWVLLNMNDVSNFLSSVVFTDSKRPYAKEVLMRIDIQKLAKQVSFKELLDFYNCELGFDELKISPNDYSSYKNFLSFCTSNKPKVASITLTHF